METPVKEASIESSPRQFTYAQLMDKVKSQASRLILLESYKEICESKISELDPSHPLPVSPGNSVKSPVKEEKSMKKDPEPEGNGHFLAEHDSVKASLRAEMMLCEEQRIYIEVLKQALESRMLEIGLGISLDDFIDYASAQSIAETSRVENARMANTVADQTAKITHLTGQLNRKLWEREKHVEERGVYDKSIGKLKARLSISENEIATLESEKRQLVEYIRRVERENTEMRLEMNELVTHLEEVHSEKKTLNHESVEMEGRYSRLEIKLAEAKGGNERTETSLRELQGKYHHATLASEEKEREIESILYQLHQENGRNNDLRATYDTLADTLRETQEEVDSLKQQQSDLTRNHRKLRESKEQVDRQLNQLTEKYSALRMGNDELLKELDERHIEFNRIQEALGVSEEENQLSALNTENLEQALQGKSREYGTLRAECDSLHSSLAQSLENIEQAERTHSFLERSLSSQRHTAKTNSEHIATMETRIKELNHSLSSSNDEYDNLTYKYKESQNELGTLTQDLDRLHAQNSHYESKLAVLLTEQESLKSHLQALTATLSHLEHFKRQCTQAINSSLKTFPPILQSNAPVQDPAQTIEYLLNELKHYSEKAIELGIAIDQISSENALLHRTIRSQADDAVSEQTFHINLLKEENNLLHRGQLELENMLTTLQDYVSSGKVQDLYYEIMELRSQTMKLEKEKIHCTAQYIRNPSDRLPAQIRTLETLLESYKARLHSLESQLRSS